ncbi:MAG: glycosyltransferase family 4 protein [Clostridia bacterium]|nr:MAG: glycosyltransferase family 4 protein [Clostridia bacterium]
MSTKVALIHDWLVANAGAEKVLAAIHELYPQAPVYTLVSDPRAVAELDLDGLVRNSFLQRWPQATKRYQAYLPFMPFAVEQFDLREYEVIISSSHAVAKGAMTRADQLHIAYIHTPVRYAWDLYYEYLREARLTKGLKAFLARVVLHYLRLWDRVSADRVDYLVANSHYVARRVWKTWRREADVIYPPVDISRFRCAPAKGDYFLSAGRLVAYKKVDVVVEAFNSLKLPLVVIGEGPELERLKRVAGPNITFLGRQPDEVVADYMARARALVFAADEDFGIVPVEVQAAGTPVIAYGKGGVRETVIGVSEEIAPEEATGLFFYEQAPEAVAEAVRRFLKLEGRFRPGVLRSNSERFSRERFLREFGDYVSRKWEEFAGARRG